MTTATSLAADPFTDPSASETTSTHESATTHEEIALALGRNISLTLGIDSLVVLDENIPISNHSLTSCFGLLPTHKLPTHKLPARFQPRPHLPTRSIPYYNIVDASLNEYDLTIYHTSPPTPRAKYLRPQCIAYPVSKDQRTQCITFLDTLLSKAYPHNTPRHRRIKVLINPFGGKGAAQKYFARDIEPVFKAAGCELSVEHTRYKGHAIDIVRELDVDVFDVVACCSGDGLPYEAFNGLAQKENGKRALQQVAVAQLPCGSGNAMSLNFNGTDSPSSAALAIVKGVRTPLDLMAVSQVVSGKLERHLSFLSQAVGIAAESDLGTEHMRWMGDLRFTVGFLQRLAGKTVYPCDVSVKVEEDSKAEIKKRFRDYHSRHSELPFGRKGSATHPSKTERTQTDDASLRTSITIETPMNTLEARGWTPLTPYPTLGNFYAGNLPYVARDALFFQATLPNDGCLDLVMIDGQVSRLLAIKMMISTSSGKLFGLDDVQYRKVSGYRIVPKRSQGYVSIDGESFPCEGFQVEVLKGAGCVLSRRGVFEAPRVIDC